MNLFSVRVNSQSLSSIGGNSINLLTVCNSFSEYELLKKAFLALCMCFIFSEAVTNCKFSIELFWRLESM